MSKAIYIATTEPNSGKSIASLGLMQLLLSKAAKVGYFRPIIDDYPHGKIDNHINTIITHFDLKLKFEDAYAFTRSEIIHKKNENKDDEIISTIIEKYKAIEDNYDFVNALCYFQPFWYFFVIFWPINGHYERKNAYMR